MNKAEVVGRYKQLLDDLGEEPRNVILSAGSALVMLGLREETASLDVDVPTNVFKWALNKTLARLKAEGKEFQMRATTGAPRFKLNEFVCLQELEESTGIVCVEGVWLYSPSALLVQKRYLSKMPNRKEIHREVDLREVTLLEQLIHGQKHTARVMV